MKNNRKDELKTVVISQAASNYSDLSAKKAADMLYASMNANQYAFTCSMFPSYDEDSGDKACRCFARWIQEDRRR